MSNQLSVVLIIGLPGTGKTTLGERFASLLGWTLITTERIRADLFGSETVTEDRDFTPDEIAITYRAVSLLARHLLSAGASIVVDGVFRSHEQRQLILDVAKDAGATFLGVHTTCSELVVIERLTKRKTLGTVSPAGAIGYQKIKNEFEPIDPSFIRVDTSSS